MKEKEHRWVTYWQKEFDLVNCSVDLERISPLQVSCQGGRKTNNSLVGIHLDGEKATLVSTRKLKEGDIVHELLHSAHPDWTEEEITVETCRLLLTKKRRR